VRADSTTETCECPLDIAELKSIAGKGTFFSYAAGTAAAVLQYLESSSASKQLHSIKEKGLLVNNYKTTLPMKKGLSSSAAVCVLVATSFSKAFDLGFDRKVIMEIAYQGEMNTPSQCGRMDQCCAMGKDSIGLMTFDSFGCDLRLLTVREPLYFVVADLMAGKDTIEILAKLNNCFPFPKDAKENRMHRFVNHNQKLCWSAVSAIEKGDARRLGDLMAEAQLVFDDCATINCPSQLTSPKLHSVMSHQGLRAKAFAIKGVGSQGDGSVQILCKGSQEQQQVLDILRGELKCDGFPLTVPVAISTPERPLLSRHRVRCALVIVDTSAVSRFPFAGSLTPPCLMPVPWAHGTKSMLASVVMELVACGVQRIAVVVSNPQKAVKVGGEDSAAADDDETADDTSNDLQYTYLEALRSSLADSDISTSDWDYSKEQFDTVKARAKFFFEDARSNSSYTTIKNAVQTLHSAAVRLSGSFSHSHRAMSVLNAASGAAAVISQSSGASVDISQQQQRQERALRRGSITSAHPPDYEIGPLLLCRAETLPLAPIKPTTTTLASIKTTVVSSQVGSKACSIMSPSSITEIADSDASATSAGWTEKKPSSETLRSFQGLGVAAGLHGFLRAALEKETKYLFGKAHSRPFLSLTNLSSNDIKVPQSIRTISRPLSDVVLNVDLCPAELPNMLSVSEPIPEGQVAETLSFAEDANSQSKQNSLTEAGGPPSEPTLFDVLTSERVYRGKSFPGNNNDEEKIVFGGICMLSFNHTLEFVGKRDAEGHRFSSTAMQMHPVDRLLKALLDEGGVGIQSNVVNNLEDTHGVMRTISEDVDARSTAGGDTDVVTRIDDCNNRLSSHLDTPSDLMMHSQSAPAMTSVPYQPLEDLEKKEIAGMDQASASDDPSAKPGAASTGRQAQSSSGVNSQPSGRLVRRISNAGASIGNLVSSLISPAGTSSAHTAGSGKVHAAASDEALSTDQPQTAVGTRAPPNPSPRQSPKKSARGSLKGFVAAPQKAHGVFIVGLCNVLNDVSYRHSIASLMNSGSTES
jgi:mevalonate kinase